MRFGQRKPVRIGLVGDFLLQGASWTSVPPIRDARSKHARSFRRLIKKCGQGPKRPRKSTLISGERFNSSEKDRKSCFGEEHSRTKAMQEADGKAFGPFKVVKRAL